MSHTYTITIANQHNNTYEVDATRPLLNSLLAHNVDLPFGCKYGGCITCAAKLIDGSIDQHQQKALNNRQVNDGYILLCIARPTSDCVINIGIDSHDTLYRNPFLDPLRPDELKDDIAPKGTRK